MFNRFKDNVKQFDSNDETSLRKKNMFSISLRHYNQYNTNLYFYTSLRLHSRGKPLNGGAVADNI